MAREGRLVYVGNLPADIKEREVEDLFHKYGRIKHIDLKTPPRPPAFAFVEFEDPRDAADAVRGRDGYDFDGSRLRVEISRGGGLRGPPGAGGGGGYGGERGGYGGGGGGGYGGGGGAGGYGGGGDFYRGGGGGGYGGDRGGGYGGHHARPPPSGGNFGMSKRTDFRVIVHNLPNSCSWQDLKDHMRRGGDVTFAQVMRDAKGMVGLVDYATADDMVRAIKKLDDTEFKNPFDKSYIRVKEDTRRGSHSRSPPPRASRRDRSRSKSRSRSRSRSQSGSEKSKSKSRSRSRSRSKSKSKSRSESRSRSRSAERDVAKEADSGDEKIDDVKDDDKPEDMAE